MSQVFISHASADQMAAERAAAALRSAGHEVWVADAALRPGDQILPTIARAIEDADVVLVLLSKTSRTSAAVETEAALAAGKILSGRGGVVIPVLLDRGIELPFSLRGFQAVKVDASDPDAAALVHAVEEAERQPVEEVLRLQRDVIEYERNSLETAHARDVLYRMKRLRVMAMALSVLAAVVTATLVVSVVVVQRDDAIGAALSLTAATAALVTLVAAMYSLALRGKEIRRLRDRVASLEDQLLKRSSQDAQ